MKRIMNVHFSEGKPLHLRVRGTSQQEGRVSVWINRFLLGQALPSSFNTGWAHMISGRPLWVEEKLVGVEERKLVPEAAFRQPLLPAA